MICLRCIIGRLARALRATLWTPARHYAAHGDPPVIYQMRAKLTDHEKAWIARAANANLGRR